ncbi:MAG TPA: hypothetical protein PKX23_13400 [Verrucomicrobiota bacterium]|jgi:hypothetical protein|nr:hypothetical protein [Verrucomicrobiota bacterium]HRT07503.1 hypothetical protein [Candidatus Paceibacterota bacterium]HRT55747.1 hypothetical protein [Candidatus Paceibacterota bacterium]
MKEKRGTAPERQQCCSVVVVHENPACREAAADFCDHLVERYRTGCEFEVNWWSFDLLAQEASARQAGEVARQADFVVFACTAGRELPAPVRTWVENWTAARGEAEGAVVVLTQPPACGEGAEPHVSLRQIAHRAGMDYLTQLPPSLGWQIPDSPECFSERAAKMTSVLDEILHYHPAPHLARP